MTRTSQLLPRDLILGLAMVAAGTAWLAWLHPAKVSDGFLADVVVAVPCAFALVLLVLPVTVLRLRRAEETGANIPIAVLRCAALVAAAIAVGNTLSELVSRRAGLELSAFGSMVNDASTLIVVLLPLSGLAIAWRPAQPEPGRRSPRRPGLVVALALAIPAALGSLPPAPAAGALPTATAADCLSGGPVDKSFDLTALNVDVPINRFGDHDPLGKMYALASR